MARPVRRFAAALLAASFLASTGVPAVASGAVRSLHIDDPIDAQDPTPSLDRRPVAPDITAVDAAYDDAGTLTVAITFVNEHDLPPVTEVAFGCAGTPVFTARLQRERAASGGDDPGWEDQGTGRLEGFEGAVHSSAPAAEGSRTVRAGFTHAQFARRGYRCVRAEWAPGGSGAEREDLASGWFAGFEPMTIGRPEAEREARAALERRLGARYRGARARYVRCPEEQGIAGEADPGEVGTDPEPASALCEFHLRRGRRVTLGGVAVKADDDARVLTSTVYPPFSYTRRWRTCSLGRHQGRIRTNEPCGRPRLLAGDIYSIASRRFPRPLARRFSVYAHGTNTAGHAPLVRFRCRSRHRMITVEDHPVRRSSVACANAVGARLRFTFNMA